jgi:hypothetical protein
MHAAVADTYANNQTHMHHNAAKTSQVAVADCCLQTSELKDAQKHAE